MVLCLVVTGCGRAVVDDGGATDSGVTQDAGVTMTCGGITGRQCPSTHRCADDTTDACDPATHTDCGGICVLK